MVKDSSYLCDLSDLLGDVLGSVFNLAGRNDFNLGGRRRSHPVRAEGQSNLRDAADGPVPHQVGVRCGVQSAGLQICSREKQHRQLRLKSRSMKIMNGSAMFFCSFAISSTQRGESGQTSFPLSINDTDGCTNMVQMKDNVTDRE